MKVVIKSELINEIAELEVPFPEDNTGVPIEKLSREQVWQIAVGSCLLNVLDVIRKSLDTKD